MIDKLFIRGFIILASFFGLWLLLLQVNWVGIFHIEKLQNNKLTERVETELGELMLREFKKESDEVENHYVTETLDSLVTKICQANDISKETLRVYILENDDVNAFALPDRQLVIYTGLISQTESPEALSGVIAHELAHIERRHVIKSLIREMGLSVLFALVSGQSDFSVMGDIIQMVSSSAFSREMEKEADLLGVNYLLNAKIDPKPFADFMRGLSKGEFSALKWISSHPMSKEREKYILKSIEKKKVTFESVIAPETWLLFKDAVSLSDETTEFIDPEVENNN